MQRDPSQSPDPTARRAWKIVLDAAREAYAAHPVDEDGDPAPGRPVTWADYGETETLPDGAEPPEPWLA